jgi:tricorn protease
MGCFKRRAGKPVNRASRSRTHFAKDTPSLLLPNNQPNPNAKPNEAAPTKIDFENLQRRFVDLPLPLRDYSQILAGRPGKFFLVTSESSNTPGDVSIQNSRVLYSFDSAQPSKMEKFVEGIGGYELTRDGSKLLYQKGRDWFLVSTDAAPKTDEGKLDLSKMEVRVTPSEEWRQMFRESMRIMRDWFYDPNYHGQNLAALEREYAAYLPTTTRRGILTLLWQMLGHVSVSHLGVGGGDTAPQAGSALASDFWADYEIADGKFASRKFTFDFLRFSNGSFSAPLDQRVEFEGDYLLEVNGQKIETNKNLTAILKIQSASRRKCRQREQARIRARLRFIQAAGETVCGGRIGRKENRKRVEQMSGGKLGYIFIENYDPNGIMNAIRGLTGYADRQGIVVDQRFNGGGITPDYLIEWMQRKPLYLLSFSRRRRHRHARQSRAARQSDADKRMERLGGGDGRVYVPTRQGRKNRRQANLRRRHRTVFFHAASD